jgi:hypothetical protein
VLILAAESTSSRPPHHQGREVGVWRGDDGNVVARTYVGKRMKWIDWPELALFEFSLGSRTVRAWPALGVDLETLQERFERVVQPVLLQTDGYQALHAGAVMGGGGVLAFCGPRFSGKSTIAHALHVEGLEQIADDALAFSVGESTVQAHPLPFSVRLRTASREHFVGRARRPVQTVHPPAAVSTIFVLHQDPEIGLEPEIVRVEPRLAFSTLLEQAYYFDQHDPVEMRRLVTDYLSVAERVPVFSLSYPKDFSVLPRVCRAIRQVAGSIEQEAGAMPALTGR